MLAETQTPGGTLQGEVVIEPEPQVITDTLHTLEEAVIPEMDLRELAAVLKGLTDIPLTLDHPDAPYVAGSQKVFWAMNNDTNQPFTVTATLAYETDHLYFWIQEGVRYNEADLRDLAETFEHEIYPTNRAFFGSEWTPGVDGDPHLFILFTGGLGERIAGYFSSADTYHPLAHPYSNGHEMFFLNSDNLNLRDPFTYSVLAHEYQHMIHYHTDRNEGTWLNEGFSELAAFLNGYNHSNHDYRYSIDTDIQLNDWPNSSTSSSPDYGASFLFLTYFLDRFGESATRALVAEQENGLNSVDVVLEQIGAADSLTGLPVGADDLFADWAVANYLQDPQAGDGRYSYSIYLDAPKARTSEEIRRCPIDSQFRTVNQYGVDYISIRCAGEYTLRFEGVPEVRVLPAEPYSGEYYFWSNKGDQSNMTLTRQFDFSGHTGPLTVSYWTWYDIEEDYDYLYLLASTDGGRWDILPVPSGTDANPSGNSYGWAYNGLSGGGPHWIYEQVDLSRFAGQEVFLRFKYVTDAAVNGEGLLLDDIAIPEIGYFSDFEHDDGGWESAGFVRIRNVLPQQYRLSWITRGAETTVEQIDLGMDQTVEIPFQIGRGVEEVVLVISGTTRYTRQPAEYWFTID
jgi:immune inhibitor A